MQPGEPVAGNPLGGFCEGDGHKSVCSRPVPTHHQMRKVLEQADNLPGRPFEVFDGGQHHLVSLIKAVQVQRNNAVHPMNEKISDDTVRLSYLAFPFALQKIEQLRKWFSSNPNVL